MKVLRFVLVFAFMFTLVISPVQAKAEERYGFIPLLTKVNPALPLQMQARQAFQKLRPQLLALQKSGAILEFDPEFGAGIVKIKYAAGASVSALGGATVFDDINAAVALVPHKKTASGASGLQAEAVTTLFYIALYDSCFDAYDLGSNAQIKASMRNKANVVVANYAGTASSLGERYACFDWHGSYTEVTPGYKLTFQIYDSTGTTLLNTYIAIAGNITFNNINKATSVVGGQAVAGKSYFIDWYHPNLDVGNSLTYAHLPGTVSPTSTWSTDFGNIPLRGGDFLDMYVAQVNYFIFQRTLSVSQIYCELGSNYCDLTGLPFQSATMTINHASTPYTFTGKFDPCGCFSVNVEDASGAPIFLAVGDTVSGTSVPIYTLPNLTAVPYYIADYVVGKAPPNKNFWVSVRDVTYANTYSVWASSDATGKYTANFSSIFDLKSTEVITLEVDYVDPTTGNETERYIPLGP